MASLHDVTVGEDIEFKRIMAKEGMTAEMVRLIIKNPPIAGPVMRDIRVALGIPYNAGYDVVLECSHLLPSLEEQLKLLHRYSEELWGHSLSDNVFASVNTQTDHVQSIENFLMLVVKFGTSKELFEAGATVIKENVPNFWRSDNLGKDYEIRPLADSTILYEAGIHVVHINLVAHWEPKDGRSVDDVRAKTSIAGEKLGYIEPLQSYGLTPKLLQQMDGTNFPYADFAGYEVKPSGGSEWRIAPCLGWDADDREASLYYNRTDIPFLGFAAPVVWES